MPLDKYLFTPGDPIPAENLDSLDPDNLEADFEDEAYRLPRLDSIGLLPAVVMGRLFGDGSDGALIVSSGVTTIDCGGAQFVTKNYTSIAITGTGKIAFSNPHAKGTVIIFNVIGDVEISSSDPAAIDVRDLGSTTTTTTGALDALDHRSSTIYTNSALYTTALYPKAKEVPVISAGTQGAGNGALGAGGLVIRCGRNLIGSGTIDASGRGYSPTAYAPCAGHKRGGGSGGDVYIGYRGTYTGTITIINNGGKGESAYASNGGSSGNNYSYSGAGSSIGAGGISGSGSSMPGNPGGPKAGGGGVGYASSCVNQNLTKAGGDGGAGDGGVIEKIYI